MQELKLSNSHLDLLMRYVRSGMPFEVCGFLGGVDGEVTNVLPVPNVAIHSAVEFLMEPQTQWNTMCMLAEAGRDIIAIYHSHPPDGRAGLSPVDIANAHYPGILNLLIVPKMSGELASLRAFSIDGVQVSEVSIVVSS